MKRAAIITASDSGYRGEREDLSGPAIREIVEKNGRLTTTGAKRTGCMFCMFGVHLEKEPNRFQRMALTHPKQYDFCIHKLGCGKVLDFLGVPYAPNGGEFP